LNIFDPDPNWKPPPNVNGQVIKGDSSLPGYIQELLSVDFVPSNMPTINGRGKLIILEDNDARIKMCFKARSTTMRHVPRVHRVDVDWLLERILVDTGTNIKYINTKAQIADIFTKGSFTELTWSVLCKLFQLGLEGFRKKQRCNSHAGNPAEAMTRSSCIASAPLLSSGLAPQFSAQTKSTPFGRALLAIQVPNQLEQMGGSSQPNPPAAPVVADAAPPQGLPEPTTLTTIPVPQVTGVQAVTNPNVAQPVVAQVTQSSEGLGNPTGIEAPRAILAPPTGVATAAESPPPDFPSAQVTRHATTEQVAMHANACEA
jgi:hypothetical protein